MGLRLQRWPDPRWSEAYAEYRLAFEYSDNSVTDVTQQPVRQVPGFDELGRIPKKWRVRRTEKPVLVEGVAPHELGMHLVGDGPDWALDEPLNIRRRQQELNGGTHSRAEWRALCERYGHRCLACGRKFERLTRDHVVPLCLGGSNTIDNIQPLCRSCNSRKGPRTVDYRPLAPWI